MTDMAIKAENIDEAKAEEARRRAEARLAEKLSDEDSEHGSSRAGAFPCAIEGQAPDPFVSQLIFSLDKSIFGLGQTIFNFSSSLAMVCAMT